MALHRIVVKDEHGQIVGLEFATSKTAADAAAKPHRDAGRTCDIQAGTLDGFNFAVAS